MLQVLVILCIAIFLFLITIGLDATYCSMDHKREMLKQVCGHYRRKRGFAYTENFRKHKHHHLQGWNRNSVTGKYYSSEDTKTREPCFQ